MNRRALSLSCIRISAGRVGVMKYLISLHLVSFPVQHWSTMSDFFSFRGITSRQNIRKHRLISFSSQSGRGKHDFLCVVWHPLRVYASVCTGWAVFVYVHASLSCLHACLHLTCFLSREGGILGMEFDKWSLCRFVWSYINSHHTPKNVLVSFHGVAATPRLLIFISFLSANRYGSMSIIAPLSPT